ncbi:MAG TPA: ATP-binding protein [Negativicutes bacterium]|nr:ATP-binding protein [Clostridia bacterium]HWR29006.1 ATP-binding protein [Negativicutes bacterium]
MIKNEEITLMEDIDLPPDPERIINGLRDTGYSFNTAIADIIDNSIAAQATKIDININLDPRNELTIYIADNGCGMDMDGLKNAMKYGSKARIDPGSLGKFGLGLKTGSTAFCRCLSVVSKSVDDDTLRKVQWDLDYIAKTGSWKLKSFSVNSVEQEMLENTAGTGSGTLVVWEKIDRLLKNYTNKGSGQTALNKIINGLLFHISMIYQRFLDPADTRDRNIEINLNGRKVTFWDPFCVNESTTEKLIEENMEVELPGGIVSSLLIRAYMLPRRDDFSNIQARDTARISNETQGFYIYRENRLIHYWDWLGMFMKEPHFSLLRVEFSFDHILDDVFNVDIKKSRILLNEDIFNHVKDQVMPAPRRAAEERYRRGTAGKVAMQGRDAHASSNKNIDDKAPAVEQSKTEVTGNDEVNLTNQYGTFKHKITIRSSAKPGQYRVIPVETLPDGQLWNPCIAEERHAVEINQAHPYYQKVYYPILSQNVMVTGMDALLWALAEAELSTVNDQTKEHYEDMRVQVSRFLKKLVADLPDPDPDPDEEA